MVWSSAAALISTRRTATRLAIHRRCLSAGGNATLEALRRLRETRPHAVPAPSRSIDSKEEKGKGIAVGEDAFNWSPSDRVKRLFKREFEHGSSSLLHIQRQMLDERLEEAAEAKSSSVRPSISVIDSYVKAEASLKKFPCKDESAINAVADEMGLGSRGDASAAEIEGGATTLGQTIVGAVRGLNDGMVNTSGEEQRDVLSASLDVSVQDDGLVGNLMAPSSGSASSVSSELRASSKVDDVVSKLSAPRVRHARAP